VPVDFIDAGAAFGIVRPAAGSSVKQVVAVVTGDDVAAFARIDIVISGSRVHFVLAVFAADDVVAHSSINRVANVATRERIVPGAAVEVIGFGSAS